MKILDQLIQSSIIKAVDLRQFSDTQKNYIKSVADQTEFKHNLKGNYYFNLKHELLDKILDVIVRKSNKLGGEYTKAINRLNKQKLVVDVLIRIGLRVQAQELINKYYKDSEKYSHIDTLLFYEEKLTEYNLLYLNDKKKANLHYQKSLDLLSKKEAQLKIIMLYNNFQSEFAQSKDMSKVSVDYLSQVLNEMKSFRVETPQTVHHIQTLEYYVNLFAGKSKDAEYSLLKLIKYYKNLWFDHSVAKGSTEFRLIHFYIDQGWYDRIEKVENKDIRNVNQVKYKFYFALYHARTRNFDVSYDTLKRLNLNQTNDIHVLCRLLKLQLQIMLNKKVDLRLFEIGEFEKDHRGVKLTKILTELFYYVRKSKADTLLKRSDSIRTIIKRYTKASDDTMRVRAMLKLLLKSGLGDSFTNELKLIENTKANNLYFELLNYEDIIQRQKSLVLEI